VRKLSAVGKMVVGDDQVKSHAPGSFGGGKCADAGVDADYQPHSFGGGAFDDVILHSIAVAYAMGDVKVGGSAENLDGALEDDDGGGSVNVVIPIYKDGFGPADRMLQRIAGGTTPAHVASCYTGLIDALVVDSSDDPVELDGGVRLVATDTLMRDVPAARRLAATALDAAGTPA